MPRVLLVVDDDATVELIRQGLGADWSRETATDLPEAVARLGHTPFDAVVLGMTTADSDARSVVGNFKAAVGQTPLVVVASLSGDRSADDALAFACLSVGVQGFVAGDEVGREGVRRALDEALARSGGKGDPERRAAGKAVPEDRGRSPALPGDANPPPRSERRRVLLVDDDEVVRRIVGRMLESRYSVTLAAGGTEALEVLGSDVGFDAIFCDVGMHDMDGTAFAEAVREGHPSLHGRVVLLSGGATNEAARESIERSGLRVLWKPCSLAELCEVVESVAAG